MGPKLIYLQFAAIGCLPRAFGWLNKYWIISKFLTVTTLWFPSQNPHKFPSPYLSEIFFMSLAKSPVKPRKGSGILGPDGKALGCCLDFRYHNSENKSKDIVAKNITHVLWTKQKFKKNWTTVTSVLGVNELLRVVTNKKKSQLEHLQLSKDLVHLV